VVVLQLQLLQVAVGHTLDDPEDVYPVIQNRFLFVGQILLVVPVICGFLTDYLGRYSHMVVFVCGVSMAVLQGLLLLPWSGFFPESEDCRLPDDPSSLSFCGAQGILLAIFLLHTVFLTQVVNQVLKMLAVRAAKVFPDDPQRRQIEIQRTGTMSIVLSALLQACLAAVAPLLHDTEHIGWVLALLGCGASLVASVLSMGYTTRSFTIRRSKQQMLPVAAVTARFTDDADSVIASETDESWTGLLGGAETGGYGCAERDGVVFASDGEEYRPQLLGLPALGSDDDGDDDGATGSAHAASRRRSSSGDGSVADFKPFSVPAKSASDGPIEPRELKPIAPGPRTLAGQGGLVGWTRRAAASLRRGGLEEEAAVGEEEEEAATVWVAGPHIDDREEVVCCQCLCCRQQCGGFSCGSKHTARGRCLSWCSGLCYLALTPVISLPFLCLLLSHVALTIADYPLPRIEAARLHPDDDILEATASSSQQPPHAADLRLTAFLEAGLEVLLMQTLIYACAALVYALVLAEMPSFRVFRTAYPGLCIAGVFAMIVFYDGDRTAAVSTTVVNLVQVLAFFLTQYLRWFLLAAVPDSLYGLLTIAIGVGLTGIGAVESRIIDWGELGTVLAFQVALVLSACTALLVSVWAHDWLTHTPVSRPSRAPGDATSATSALMHTAVMGGFGAAPLTSGASRAAAELFAGTSKPSTSQASKPAPASLSGYHNRG
jgi:hypothetical protein